MNEGSSNAVSVIDGAADSLITTITVGDIPVGACVNLAKSRIYVGCFGQGTIWVLQDQAVGINQSPVTKPGAFDMTAFPNPCRNQAMICLTVPSNVSKWDIRLSVYCMVEIPFVQTHVNYLIRY